MATSPGPSRTRATARPGSGTRSKGRSFGMREERWSGAWAEFLLRVTTVVSGLRLQRTDFMLLAPRELFALGPTRSTEPEVRDHERMVVLALAVLIRPVVRSDVSLHDELI